MFSSETMPRDSFKPLSNEGHFLKSDSDYFQTQNSTQLSQNSGLARYRSAPSSFFATLLNSETDNSISSGDESDAILSAFLNDSPRDLSRKNDDQFQVQYGMKQETGLDSDPRPGQSNGFSSGHMGYGSGPYGQSVNGNGNGNGSNLVRQSSSPAGFLNGFSLSGEMGNYKVQSHQETGSSAIRLSNQINFSSGQSSSLSLIPENGNESIHMRSHADCQSRNGSWNESSFGSLKRNADGNLKRNSDGSEMANVERFLQFEQDKDTVPCQMRAKRGFATHPRSIAERVRRTKITEKMKKLQDLFPNIDKQTNQADMLDLAVKFIKDLKKQVQVLRKPNCRNSHVISHQPSFSLIVSFIFSCRHSRTRRRSAFAQENFNNQASPMEQIN